MSESYAIRRATPEGNVFAAIALIGTLVLVAAPWWAGRADLRLFGELFLYIALASLWNLLAGYSGLVSVGQQLYVGLGGYALFACAILWGINPLLAIPLAGVLGAMVALPVSWLLFRLHGAHFAIGTWVAAEVFLLGVSQIPLLGGGSGQSLPAALVAGIASNRDTREALVYWLAAGLMFGTLAVVIALLRSRVGLALTSIRDSEIASESLGIDIGRTKSMLYAATAAATSMIGALIFLQKLRISPQAAFSVNDWTAFVIFMVVIGGIGTIEGPIIGAIVFFVLRELLADYGTIYLFVLGLSAIIIMLRAPKGLWGTVAERYNLALIPIRRKVVEVAQTSKTISGSIVP